MVIKMNLDVKFNEEQAQVIQQYIINKVKEANSEGVVIGVSGGLDSAVVLNLCSLIFPKEQINAVFLPESATPAQDTKDAHDIAELFGLQLMEIEIDSIVQLFKDTIVKSDPSPLSLGNLKARIRMNILYFIANISNRLVIGTSNKSELLLGYFTKYGDGGSDIAPLGDLYKTQVKGLARSLKLPEPLILKPPTAGLVVGQTDEEELGLDYETIDKILFGLERDLPVLKIAQKLNLDAETVENIKQKVEVNRHKRKFSKIPKLGLKTIGVDLYE
jgi:NAD+ synthase